MRRNFQTLSFLFLFVALISPSHLIFGQGDLMILPKRLVFDGSHRSQEINLANTGKDTAVYAISFINYRMTDSGSFEQIEEPEEGQHFATDFLRYYPRRVSLAPNEAQTIRVQLTRTGNLEEGEYRSHMYFRAVEDQTALGEEDINSTEAISIQIKTVFGISIPVIIRHGENITTVGLGELELDMNENATKLSMTIYRQGNMSVYGNLQVEHISPQGKTTVIGLVKGISVYTPNHVRHFSMQLDSENVNLNEGKLKVTYSSVDDEELGMSELNLNQANNN